MSFVTHNGARIHYETHGTGEPLLLIMGLGGHSGSWALQVPVLAEHFQVITLDNRGAGRSDAPDEPYSIELFAEDVRAVLDDVGLGAVHVLGASMGGLIAQEFYHRYPERVVSLILACTGVGANDPHGVLPEPAVVEALELDRRREDPRRVMTAMIEAFYHPVIRERIPDLVERALAQQALLPQPAHAYEAQLRACVEHVPNSPRLARIRVPTLVLHGVDDRVWPLANAHCLARGIPNAVLHLIPESAHMFMLEKPRAFNAAVLDFLQRQRLERQRDVP